MGRIKHGKYGTRLYTIWSKMKARCLNINNHVYKYYGGRGISICKEWLENFIAFYNWSMVNGYADNLTIDRIDNNKGYSPENCRWTTQKIQSRNTRQNKLIEYNGQVKCIAEWAELYSLNQRTLESRLKRGWSIHEAFNIVKNGSTERRTSSCRKKGNIHATLIDYNGEKMTYKEWGKKLNISHYTIRNRLLSGWSIERALNTPISSKMKK